VDGRHQLVDPVLAVQAEDLGHGRLEVGPDPVGPAAGLAVEGLAHGQQ
jgi:hypothetical protein